MGEGEIIDEEKEEFFDSVIIESRGRVTSHMFVKEPEGSLEKKLKYVNCSYGRIFIPNQKQNFMIYACTIAGRIKAIERERYANSRK